MDGIREITLPSKKISETSEVIERCGLLAKPTDLAVAMNRHNDESEFMSYYLSTINTLNNKFYIVQNEGKFGVTNSANRCGVRPIVKLTAEAWNEILNKAIEFDGIKIVQYGEFPQTTILQELSSPLTTTGKVYEIKGQNALEYSFKNQKVCQIGDTWYKVEPIEWLVDEDNHLLLARHVLLAGLSIDRRLMFDGTFEQSRLYEDLNTLFIKDIIPSRETAYDEDQLLDLARLELIKQRLSAETSEIKEEVARKEKLIAEVLRLKSAINIEKQKSDALDKQLEELTPSTKGKAYVRR